MSLIPSALVTSEGKGRGYADSKAGWEAPCQSSWENTGAFLLFSLNDGNLVLIPAELHQNPGESHLPHFSRSQ